MSKRTGRGLPRDLALLAGSLAVSLGIAELVVARLAPQELTPTFRIHDERGLTLHDPDRSVRLPSGVEYLFDARGLRVDPSLEGPDPVVRVLALGDSFTFGWRLDASDTYVSRLERLADDAFEPDRVRILNAGHGGWGAADYVSFLEHYGEGFAPDAVLVFLNFLDVQRARATDRYEFVSLSADSHALREKTRVTAGRSLRNLARAMPAYNWLLEHSHLAQLTRKTLFHSGSLEKAVGPDRRAAGRGPDPSRLARALFTKLRDECRARGLELLVVTTGFLEAGPRLLDLEDDPARDFYETAESFSARSASSTWTSARAYPTRSRGPGSESSSPATLTRTCGGRS